MPDSKSLFPPEVPQIGDKVLIKNDCTGNFVQQIEGIVALRQAEVSGGKRQYFIYLLGQPPGCESIFWDEIDGWQCRFSAYFPMRIVLEVIGKML